MAKCVLFYFIITDAVIIIIDIIIISVINSINSNMEQEIFPKLEKKGKHMK